MTEEQNHPLYDSLVARVLFKTYLDWEVAGRPLDTPQWPKVVQDFLGEMIDDRLTPERLKKNRSTWMTWFNGCFVGFLAREQGFEAAIKQAHQICVEMTHLSHLLPWPPTTSVYSDDGPGERTEFEVLGVSFVVAPTEHRGCDTGRVRFFVSCQTCQEVVHEATTSATCLIESHMRESHGWDPDGQRI